MSAGFSWGCSSARCIPPHPGARCCGGCGAMNYFYIPQEDVENTCLMVVYDGLMVVYDGLMVVYDALMMVYGGLMVVYDGLMMV